MKAYLDHRIDKELAKQIADSMSEEMSRKMYYKLLMLKHLTEVRSMEKRDVKGLEGKDVHKFFDELKSK